MRPASSTFAPVFAFGIALAVAACGGGGGTDAGTDAPADLGTDQGIDAPADMPQDTGSDLGQDMPADLGADVGPVCGDGVVNGDELCDTAIAGGNPGACPVVCDDGIDCTVDLRIGNDCEAECQATPITLCIDSDGCCASGCNNVTDVDCEPACGNGVVESGESCDTAIAGGMSGTCPTGPTDCDDGNACTTETIDGSACTAACVVAAAGCTDGDGCCPAACNATNDDDCIPCGNGVIDPQETCDGNCPATCADTDACTTDGAVGSASTCDLLCTHNRITTCVDEDGCCTPGCTSANDDDCPVVCGNGAVEPGETCDGNCPASCDDGDPCTTDVRAGATGTCDVTCTNTDIFICDGGDGCCAAGCTNANDTDCSPTCGNGVIETGETCEDSPGLECPVFCMSDMDPCTRLRRSGSVSQCNVVCAQVPITQCGVRILGFADGCCPGGCDGTNDTDCEPSCGNDSVEPGELCDGNCPTTCEEDGNVCTGETLTGTPATCDVACTHPAITTCVDDDDCCPASCGPTTDTDCIPPA